MQTPLLMELLPAELHPWRVELTFCEPSWRSWFFRFLSHTLAYFRTGSSDPARPRFSANRPPRPAVLPLEFMQERQSIAEGAGEGRGNGTPPRTHCAKVLRPAHARSVEE